MKQPPTAILRHPIENFGTSVTAIVFSAVERGDARDRTKPGRQCRPISEGLPGLAPAIETHHISRQLVD
jgi:hypothetical protein